MIIITTCIDRTIQHFFKMKYLLLVTAVLASSCTKHEILDHSYQFNQAVGTASNRLLLLNAVRAAKGYPLQFSKLSGYTGEGRVSSNLNLEIPTIRKIVGIPNSILSTTTSSGLNLSTGIKSLQLVDLNTQEAQQALKKLPSYAEYKYYSVQGRHPRLVNTMMIQTVKVPSQLVKSLTNQYYQFCNRSKNNPRCKLRKLADQCSGAEISVTLRGISYHQFTNQAHNRCDFVLFQWFFDTLSTAGGNIDFDVPHKTQTKASFQKAVYSSDKFSIDVNVKLPSSKIKKIKTQKPGLFFQNRSVQSVLERQDNRRDTGNHKIDEFEITFRSPEGMVRYLGQLIYAQLYSENRYTPEIRLGKINVELFKVAANVKSSNSAAVAITDPEGKNFTIPRPDYRSPSRHRSLQAMAFVIDFLNGAVSGVSLPAPSPILLSAR